LMGKRTTNATWKLRETGHRLSIFLDHEIAT
jgi:hypothetical protein